MTNRTRELLDGGCTHEVTYRWADGYRQTAYFTAAGAREHTAWLTEYDFIARRCWVRDTLTGRFCRA